MQTKQVMVDFLEEPLEAYTFKDCEYDTSINIAMFEDGSGIVIQDMFEEENPREVVIDVKDIRKLRTILRYCEQKCKNKAEAVQKDSSND